MTTTTLLLAIAVGLLAGCGTAATAPAATYGSGERRDLSSAAAEQAHRESVGRMVLGAPLDKPLRLIKAPLPGMPNEAIRAGLQDTVVVELAFSESGNVEKVTPRQSTQSMLLGAVLVVVRDWEIEPPTRGGQPTKVIVRQSFVFSVEP